MNYLVIWTLQRGPVHERLDAANEAIMQRIDGLLAMERYAVMIERDPKKAVHWERDPPLTRKERTA